MGGSVILLEAKIAVSRVTCIEGKQEQTDRRAFMPLRRTFDSARSSSTSLQDIRTRFFSRSRMALRDVSARIVGVRIRSRG